MKLLKKLFIISSIGAILFGSIPTFADEITPDGDVLESETPSTQHTINVMWLLDPNGNCGTEPPFSGASVIGVTSFIANEGE